MSSVTSFLVLGFALYIIKLLVFATWKPKNSMGDLPIATLTLCSPQLELKTEQHTELNSNFKKDILK